MVRPGLIRAIALGKYAPGPPLPAAGETDRSSKFLPVVPTSTAGNGFDPGLPKSGRKYNYNRIQIVYRAKPSDRRTPGSAP